MLQSMGCGSVGCGCGRLAEATAAMRSGRAIVVVTKERGTDIAALVFAARTATSALVAFTVRHTSGYLCVSLPADRLADLGLTVLGAPSATASGLRYAVTVDIVGSGTGISARSRAATISALADPTRGPREFTRPGHVVPVQADQGGARRGLAEAGLELAAFAGRPAAAFAHLVSIDDPRELAGAAEAHRFADRHDLALVHVDDLIAHQCVVGSRASA